MKRLELLQERYEDALFALLMEHVALSEGRKAWEENERLKRDPGAEIPEEVHRRCLRTIRRYFTKQTAQTAGHYTVVVFKRAMMAAGIAAVLFTCAFASSETVRRNTMNLVMEVFDDYTEFRYESAPPPTDIPLNIGWIPDGYKLVKQVIDSTGIYYEYERDETEYFVVEYAEIGARSIGIDTENADVEYIELNGTQAMYVQKEEERMLMWQVNNKNAVVLMMGGNINEEEFLGVAKGLLY